MSTPANRPAPQLVFDPNSLPIPQLESLKFKANQIIESIQTLQRTLEAGGQNVMAPWPDILSKYNLILSQTHSFYSSLTSSLSAASQPNSSSQTQQTKSPYEKIALHPSVAMTDIQFDTEIIPLLRNQQTTDVLQQETATVRRLAECMVTRGALAISGGGVQNQNSQPAAPSSGIARTHRAANDDVLRECAEIREAHDHRTERAVRAVLMLRDKYEWKQRVAVEVEEPDELQWDPRMAQQATDVINGAEVEQDADIDADEGQSSDEEEVVEGELTGDDGQTPSPPYDDVEMAPTDN